MRPPNVHAAVVSEENIVDYLLNSRHPDGAGKATFFAARGFRRDQWRVLSDALRRLAAENAVTCCMASAHGRKYIVDGRVETPDGTAPLVRTVWMVDHGKRAPRLVTAYPCERKEADDQ